MPDCIVEYSKRLSDKIEVKKIVEAAHNGAIKSELFDGSKVKTRATPIEHQILREDRDIIHVTIRFLAGRTDDQKMHLSDCIVGELCSLGLTNVAISADVYDLSPGYSIKLS